MPNPVRLPDKASLIAAALAMTLLPAAALAQYGPPPGPPGPGGAPPAPSPQSEAQRLRASLSLNSAQEGALQAYIQAIQPPPGVIQKMQADAQNASRLPTPQRLDFALARMDQMRSLMATYAAATKRFYAQLTPAQQRTFDGLPPPR